jgi:hypothetical protein
VLEAIVDRRRDIDLWWRPSRSWPPRARPFLAGFVDGKIPRRAKAMRKTFDVEAALRRGVRP